MNNSSFTASDFSIHCSSDLDNVSHLINRSITTTLSNSLLCNILLFGDNQFNEITNMLIVESTVDFCKKNWEIQVYFLDV